MMCMSKVVKQTNKQTDPTNPTCMELRIEEGEVEEEKREARGRTHGRNVMSGGGRRDETIRRELHNEGLPR